MLPFLRGRGAPRAPQPSHTPASRAPWRTRCSPAPPFAPAHWTGACQAVRGGTPATPRSGEPGPIRLVRLPCSLWQRQRGGQGWSTRPSGRRNHLPRHQASRADPCACLCHLALHEILGLRHRLHQELCTCLCHLWRSVRAWVHAIAFINRSLALVYVTWRSVRAWVHAIAFISNASSAADRCVPAAVRSGSRAARGAKERMPGQARARPGEGAAARRAPPRLSKTRSCRRAPRPPSVPHLRPRTAAFAPTFPPPPPPHPRSRRSRPLPLSSRGWAAAAEAPAVRVARAGSGRGRGRRKNAIFLIKKRVSSAVLSRQA